MIKIQYGCGTVAPDSWVNFDSSLTITLQRLPVVGGAFRGGRFPNFPKNIRRASVSKGLPVASGSADLVYCSHVLEHLTLEEFRAALRETHRMLKPGGTFRFVLPDLEQAIEDYNNGDPVDRSMKFMKSTLLGKPKRGAGLEQFMRSWLGGSEHLWMWDYPGMAQELAAVGFKNIRRAHYHDSTIEDFKEVEHEGRWTGCLGVECSK